MGIITVSTVAIDPWKDLGKTYVLTVSNWKVMKLERCHGGIYRPSI